MLENLYQDPIQLLAQLAREYDEKHRQMQQLSLDLSQQQLLRQLLVQQEMLTEQFRAAQRHLLTAISSDEVKPDESVLKATITMCRCFDGLHIVCQELLDRISQAEQ